MKKLILAAALLIPFTASAELDILNIGDTSKADAKIIIGIGSRHFDKVDHMILNEINPAIGLEAWDIQAVYVSKNSWNEKSLYLTWSPDYKINEYITLSANIGIATGYKCDNSVQHDGDKYVIGYCSDSGIIPMYAATIDYIPFANNFAISASANHSVVMFSVNYSFK